MNGVDIIKIGDIFSLNFGYKCPTCNIDLLAHSIDEYYTCHCKQCGLEIKMKFNEVD